MSPPMAGPAEGARTHRPRCVLDASVLYQGLLRNLLLWIAAEGGLNPIWTERILEETRRSLIEDGTLEPEQWERLQAAMLASFPEAMLDQAAADEMEHEMPNDEKDRHVLAAAVAGDADLVITGNLRHFAQTDVEKVGKRAASPDQVLCELLAATPAVVESAMQQLVAVMRTPRSWTLSELLGRLAGLGRGDELAPRFAAAAAARLDIEMAVPPERPLRRGGQGDDP
ncbi:MAG TPA: PIN domain-containing protein [Solirubrobacteraceae bacterium]|nr:PIN domain-containing protein [Solirubrobacteraceae bacterium]